MTVPTPEAPYGVDPLGPHGLDQVVEEARLGTQQVLAVEGPPEEPVGGVEQAHTRTVFPGLDRTPTTRGGPAAGSAARGPATTGRPSFRSGISPGDAGRDKVVPR